MNKKVLSLLLLAFFSLSLQADHHPLSPKDPAALLNNEISHLKTLIEATEKSLEGQKKLLLTIVEYQKLQEDYLKSPEDNEKLLKVIKSAYRTLRSIKENHLSQTFDPDFIDELTILSQPATKRGIPKP